LFLLAKRSFGWGSFRTQFGVSIRVNPASLQKFRDITRRHHIETGDYGMHFHVPRPVCHRKPRFRKKSRSAVCSSMDAGYTRKQHKFVIKQIGHPFVTFTLDT
jgi:hypothetical protein